MKNFAPGLPVCAGSNFTGEYLGEFKRIWKYFRVLIWGLGIVDWQKQRVENLVTLSL
jgi:hypothetical protein